jgi:hypothetical protein
MQDTKKIYSILVICMLLAAPMIFAQFGGGAHPGTEDGLPTPVDGGLLMGILAAGGVVIGILKGRKKTDK